MMNSANLAYTSIIFILILHSGQAIKCFKCSSFNDKNCGDNPSNESLVECEPNHTICRKTYQYLINEEMKRITRGCGYLEFEGHSRSDYCMVSNTNLKNEIVCQCFKDNCNSGRRMQIVQVLLALCTLIAFFNTR